MTDFPRPSQAEPATLPPIFNDPSFRTAIGAVVILLVAFFAQGYVSSIILMLGGAAAIVGLAFVLKGSGAAVTAEDPAKLVEATRLRKAIANADTNIMIADENMTIVYMNNTMVRMFEEAAGDIRKELPTFDPSRLLGSNPDIFHKNPAHQRSMVKALSTTHFAEITVGGRIFSLIASPIMDDENVRIGTIIEWNDLTKKRETEAREAELLGELNAVDLAQARISYTPDGDIIEANENFLNLMGYRADEVAGRNHNIFVDEDYARSIDYRTFWDELRDGRFQSGEYSRVSKRGDDIFVLGTYNPVMDQNGKLIKVVQYATDVTEATKIRIEAEQERKRVELENTRIRFALDVCTTNVMVADVDRNVVYTNNTMQTMLREVESEVRKDLPNFAAASVVGTNIDNFHKNPNHQINMLNRLMATHETSLKIGDNHFRLIINPVANADGDRIGFVVEWDNITNEHRIKNEVDVMVGAVTAGDFTKRINTEGLDGFRLALGSGLNTLCEVLADGFSEFASALGYMSKGDMTYRIARDFEGTFADVQNDVHTTFERLTEIVTRIQSGAQEVSSAASEISAGSMDLSQRTETQAASIEETASAMEEISTTVRNNADNAQQANSLGTKTRDVADTGGQIVQNAVSAMSAIEQSSQKISDIIGVIDEIAFQTNLLALNAAVEAARAGDAGKGFAVVATEVRNLAQRSSDAAKNIKELIVDSNSQVQNGVELVNKTGNALGEIVSSIQELTSIVSEIASASREQASGLDEINTAISSMDEMTQQNSALVEESTASAKSLEEQAATMLEELTFFDIGKETPLIHSPRKRKGGGRSQPQPLQIASKARGNSEEDWAEF